jgi:menaquinone-specific isochorismate synthase
VTRIRAGEVQKVVLSRDVLAHTEVAVDPRYLIGRLMRRYPSCWTYCVDGLLGATPELLIRRRGRVVDSRVLAGTMPPGLPDDGGLMQSAKNRSEHAFSVRSVAEILAGYCDELTVPDAPSLLRLPNLVHLATDIRGTVSNGTQALSLAAALHPTAAVCGTPTDVAFDLIPLLEQMDRRRYYGPIGWVDATGNGEFGIALRGAEVDGTTVRLIAGGGIVADSEPERELAEADTKFRVMREALDG